MKNSSNSQQKKSHKDSQTFEQLKSIFTLFNENTFSSRRESFTLLLEIDTEKLSVNSLTFYHYVFGRFYLNQYNKVTNNISDLENANKCFDDSAFTEILNGHKTTNQNYLFFRIKCKYLLAKAHYDIKREEFLCYALHLATSAIKLNPNNSSFKSLLHNLENIKI